MKIWIANDHAGYALKQTIISQMTHYQFNDLGSDSMLSVDYPDFAQKLCLELKDDDRGILICGSGIGMSIAANRFSHIRAALDLQPRIGAIGTAT